MMELHGRFFWNDRPGALRAATAPRAHPSKDVQRDELEDLALREQLQLASASLSTWAHEHDWFLEAQR